MMQRSRIIPAIFQWLQSTELFSRPSRQIRGRWALFEFYVEPGEVLIHRDEKQLRDEKLFWEIEIAAGGSFRQRTNIPGGFLPAVTACQWRCSKNFLLLSDPGNPENKREYQFAIDRGILKLLKKRVSGKIEVFAFFRPMEGSKALF